MKFGKGILREILQSNPEWAPFWLNYKNLKKRIKAVAKVGHHAANQRDICTFWLAHLRRYVFMLWARG